MSPSILTSSNHSHIQANNPYSYAKCRCHLLNLSSAPIVLGPEYSTKFYVLTKHFQYAMQSWKSRQNTFLVTHAEDVWNLRNVEIKTILIVALIAGISCLTALRSAQSSASQYDWTGTWKTSRTSVGEEYGPHSHEAASYFRGELLMELKQTGESNRHL